jgi:hypothetical protein
MSSSAGLSCNHLTAPAPSRLAAAPYAAPMDSADVTADQADALANRVGPMTGYLSRLYERMQKRAWAADDSLYRDVIAAQDALHRLHLTLRELARLQRAASAERRPWEPGGSGRDGE